MNTLLDKILLKLLSYREQYFYRRFLTRHNVSLINPSSLLFYCGNIHSQRGQDMILAEIFRRLSIGAGVFVEFGAWDGMYLCNSRWLYEKGWSGIFIEADAGRYKKLCSTYASDRDVLKINAMVGAPGKGVQGVALGELLKQNDVSLDDVTFVSIDVDGPDLEIFSEMGFRPPVVLLEGGFNFSPYLEGPIPADIAWKNMQQPLHFIFSVARNLGYQPVCFYQDTYLVRSDLAKPFDDCVSDAVGMYSDAFWFMPHDYRAALLNLRKNSDVIRKLEKDYFGSFKINPLEYFER
jgi:hypothetical protein